MRYTEIASGLWGFAGILPKVLKVYSRSGKSFLIISAGLVVYDGLAGTLSLWLTKVLIDEGMALWSLHEAGRQELSYDRLAWLLTGQAVIWIVAATSEIFWRPMTEILGERACHTARQDLCEKASRVPYRYYEDGDFYDKIESAQSAQEWPQYTSLFLFSATSAIVRLISVAGLLAVLSVWFPVFIVLSTLPFLVAQVRYIVDGHQLFRFQSSSRRRLEYHARVLVDRAYAKEVRLFGFANSWLADYRRIWENCYRESKGLFLVRNRSVLLADTPGIAIAIGSYVYLAVQAINGSVTAGGLAMGLAAILQVRSATKTVANGVAQIFQCSLRVSDYFRFMDLEDEKAVVQPCLNWSEREASARCASAPIISFRQVCYDYPGDRSRALRDVTFDIYENETVAIVGRNGAGKTTVVKLLCGLLEPTEGQIVYRGRESDGSVANLLMSATSAVFQDYAKYELTVRRNVELGDVERISKQDHWDHLSEVAGSARLLDVLAGLPEGLETQLGPSLGGTDVSDGQWQHIALGRCLFKDRADIVILDEPTAAMDPEAEFELYKLLSIISRKKTSILVSHRLSTVRAADRILVFDDGALLEQGSHEELLSREGLYARFFHMQGDRYSEV